MNMEPLGKTAGRNLVETLKYEIVSREQSETGKNVQDLDHFIRQAIGKETFLSYTRPSESPGQWVQWLETFDQKSVNKLSKGSKVEAALDKKGGQKENVAIDCSLTDSNQMKESLQSKMKATGAFGKGLHSPTQLMHSLKIPEAVVAFAQAAAKTNGEQDKYLPGWPLLSPKVQMLRCEKCSQEFCSSLNHRRHTRMHRRRLNMEKEDLRKERENIAAFWDKLSIDEARQVVSFKNIMLKEVPETSIVRTLSSFIQQSALSALPQFYLKAGAALLDVVQVKPSKFPLAAKDLFSILDDASERTFLCAGSSVSVQRLVFEGEAGNVGPEVKNLVASLGFLVEQKLVKAWIANKDAEALRCQKELVEEEEAIQKKQAELLERRRLKKLRQQESREKGRKAGNPDISVDGVSAHDSSIFTELVGCNSLTAVECSTPSTAQDLSNQEQPGDVSSFEVQRSEQVESKISKLIGQDFSQHGSNSISKNADQVHLCEKNTHLNVGTVFSEETGEAQNANNVRKNHTDFDLSNYHILTAEAPLTTVSCLANKQGDQENSNVEYNTRAIMPSDKQFVQGCRQRKKYVAVDSVYSGEYPYGSDRRFSETNMQRNLKATRKSNNGLSSGKKSVGTVVISKPLSGEMSDKYRDIAVGQRVSAIANGYKMWTRKMHQISISDSCIAAESQNSKDNIVDSGSVGEPDMDVNMASYVSSSGAIGKDLSVLYQHGSEFKSPEMDSSESNKNNMVPAFMTSGNNGYSYYVESVPNCDFLIGSMSVSLSNFLDGLPQQPSPEGSIITDIKLRGLLPTSQPEAPFESALDIIQKSEFRYNTDSQIHKSSGNCSGKGFTECCNVSNGILEGNVSDNVKPGKENGNSDDIRRVPGEGEEGPLLHMSQGPSGARIRENHDYIHNKTIETIDEFELKVLLACDAASAFLSQRWKDAMSDPGAIVVLNPSSGVVEGVNDTSQ